MNGKDQKTILLVEDEAITAMSEKSAMEKYGYDVITALSGEEAVAMVEKTPAIDLILMDINLGKGSTLTSYGYVVKDSSITVLDASIKMAFKLFAAKMREEEKEKACGKVRGNHSSSRIRLRY